MIYYNEFDPFAAEWLHQLMKAGLIPQGHIDTRSITEVKADEIRHYTQCHFFAGIGGWSEALRLAGWSTERPVWTGSCPCQPFSSAGNKKGKADERHLWPIWFNLIRECRPATIFGEQVSSAIAHGWLDDVYTGLEEEGYACGSAVLPACSVGTPHKRDRLWFVAYSQSARMGGTIRTSGCSSGRSTAGNILQYGRTSQECSDVANTECGRSPRSRQLGQSLCSKTGGDWKTNQPDNDRAGHWQSGIFIDCPDGKQRLVEPGIRLLAHGVQNRVGKLRGYGNAIVPQVAAEFIGAFMEVNNATK